MQDFEKLGAFYLGKQYNLDSATADGPLVMYDSKDLVTHAVCVGMTGSGKTGLCLALLEEAAIDGVPAIVIDPKGDLGNLLLTFPNLAPSDFRPWINQDDARKAGVDPDTFAQQQASLWTKGLADWGQDGARIARLKDACEAKIYTPGSSAGVQVAVLKSFAVPPAGVLNDSELLRDRVSSAASSLLGLVGIKADPMKSREHILLCNILYLSWTAGKDLDLTGLIAQVQKPPFSRVGAMELEAFYPAKQRFELASNINALLASPGFAAWAEGMPLDIGKILYTESGKPRLAVFSIAHLDDASRMFFVTLLMNEVLGWSRSQSGTTSLRAIVYMDEIAGYVPPVGNPPSKQPILTLMKQGRAFGIGMVLATQNPVDLDYKGLSNAGTWLIGRLQTEQDKARVLDGLEGASAQASAKFDRATADRTLSRLGKRVFLMNNIHEKGPVIFQSRFCLSYLRGPLTRDQIRALTHGQPQSLTQQASIPTSNPFGANVGGNLPFMPEPIGETGAFAGQVTSAAGGGTASGGTPFGAGASRSSRPILPPGISEYFVPRVANSGYNQGVLEYQPALIGFARVWFADAKLGVDTDTWVTQVARFGDGPMSVDFEQAHNVEIEESSLLKLPEPGFVRFADLVPRASDPRAYSGFARDFGNAVFRTARLPILRVVGTKHISLPHETEAEFRARLGMLAREGRDAMMEKMRQKYGPKITAIQEKMRKAEQKIQVQQNQAKNAQFGTVLSAGAAILGGLLGRKTITAGNIGKVATAARSAGRAAQEKSDVARAQEDLETLQAQMAALETDFKQEVDVELAKLDASGGQLETIEVKAKKAGVQVRAVCLCWLPTLVESSGHQRELWR